MSATSRFMARMGRGRRCLPRLQGVLAGAGADPPQYGGGVDGDDPLTPYRRRLRHLVDVALRIMADGAGAGIALSAPHVPRTGWGCQRSPDRGGRSAAGAHRSPRWTRPRHVPQLMQASVFMTGDETFFRPTGVPPPWVRRISMGLTISLMKKPPDCSDLLDLRSTRAQTLGSAMGFFNTPLHGPRARP